MDSQNRYRPLRHWHAHSETFSGGDSLLTALRDGWQIQAIYHQWYQPSGRTTSVYHMILQQGTAAQGTETQDTETAIMRIISNPFVERFVSRLTAPVYLIEDTKEIPGLSQLEKIAR